MGELLSGGTVGHIGNDYLKKQRERIIKSWGDLGFLDGLKGHIKENVAQMYECCSSSRLLEESSGTTKDEPILPMALYVANKWSEAESGKTD